ncbi:MAG: hypothetical protein ACYS99_12860 [Planctomycetota bacterium]|jgi:hypothetical protein
MRNAQILLTLAPLLLFACETASPSRDEEWLICWLPIYAKVTSVSEEYHVVRLSVGSDDNVKVGYEFTISRGDEYVGKVVIFRVERDWSFGYSKKGVERMSIKVGDDATELSDSRRRP